MKNKNVALATVATMAGLLAAGSAPAAEASDVEVLRNTVVNILDAMVQKGLITREMAGKMVADAQAKAEADAGARGAADAAQPGDVRVTYVPQVVKDEISEQVSAEVSGQVTEDVVARARTEGWGVPAALPEWVRGSRWSGDLRVRVAPIFLANGNAENTYLNFQAINDKGGIGKAGTDALLNTTEDEVRYNARLRFGVESTLSDVAIVGFRLATGDPDNPVSANVGLDNYNTGFQLRVDEAFLRLGGNLAPGGQRLYAWAGRMKTPFDHTELVFDPDLRMNGFALQYAWNGSGPRGLFASAGVFPLDGIDVSSDDKWLAGAQFGVEWGGAGDAVYSLATAWYDFRNETGRRNPAGSSEFDYTAPAFLQKGNTLFDIADPSDSTADLFALAADYGLLDITARAAFTLQPDLRLDLAANYVTNLGYDEGDVLERIGVAVPGKTDGWRAEVRLGRPKIAAAWDWSVGVAYTYLERDAVLDAWADSDFHGGGTDAKGYTLAGELGITRNTWLRLRYLSANEIDGPALGVDTLLIDLNASF